MSDTPFIRSSHRERRGSDDTDVVVANHLIAALLGKQVVQFCMGYGVHLELGGDH